MVDSLLDDEIIPDNKNEREELYNKWKTKFPDAPPELLNSKVDSDLFIKIQNARFDNIREDYLKLREDATARASLEELIARQEKLLTNPEIKPAFTPAEETKPSIKPEDIDSILEQKLTAREKLHKQTDNFNMVKARLREQFGDKSSEVLKQRMDTLGLDQAFTDDLAKTHPSVFFKTFGLDEARQSTDVVTLRTSRRPTTSFAPTVQKRDWNYYQELNKHDPRAYLDPKIAIQMHNDAIELGAAFGMPEN